MKKKVFYLIAALIVLSSCTLSEEDVPQPISEDFTYEASETNGPSHGEESSLGGGAGIAAEGQKRSLIVNDEADPSKTYLNHDLPEDSLIRLQEKESQNQEKTRRKTQNINLSELPGKPTLCPDLSCKTKKGPFGISSQHKSTQ